MDELTQTSEDALACLGLTPAVQDQDFLKELSTASFIPSLRLNTKSSDEREDVRFYYLYEDQKHVKLDKELDVVFLNWLPKAVNTDSGISIFTKDHPKFIEIQESASIRTGGPNPNMWGITVLVYIPKYKKAADLFFGTATMRNEVKKVMELMSKTATLGCKTIPHKVHGNYLSASIDDATTPAILNNEDMEIIKAANEKFLKFPENAIRKLEEASPGGEADTTAVER